MSSSLNFYNALSITMEAQQADDHPTSWITIKAVGDHHWHNHHETTIFVSPEDYPYFARAVEAFNKALAKFYEIKATAEASANEIDDRAPF